LAEQIKEHTGLVVELTSGKVGELSVYWKEEKISTKGDLIGDIVKRLQKKCPPS
jgi:hypothetical protein